MPGVVEQGLEILTHGAEFAGADVEGRLGPFTRQRRAEPDGLAEILDIQVLVTVAPVAEDGEAMAIGGPFVEQGEDAEALLANEGLGAEDGHDEAFVPRSARQLFRLDLRFAIRADADEWVAFVQRVVVGDAIDGRAGNVHDALAAGAARFFQHEARAFDFGG